MRGNVYAISCSELLIENFDYDGTGPQVYAFIGTNPAGGPTGSSVGADATVMDKSQTFTRFPNRRYTNESIRVFLPESYNLNQIRWLSIWCKAFDANFGHITLASDNQVVEDVCSRQVFCQQLREGYDMCWSVNSTGGSVEVTLCSNIVKQNRFMGFGISKSPTSTRMVGSDPTLCWLDDDDKWNIQDYYISAYAQCGASGDTVLGVCQDTRYGGVDDLTETGGQEADGVACCTFTRPLNSSDTQYDNPISLTGPQAVVWAMGPVNQGVILQHPTGFRATPNVLVDFASGSTSNASLCGKLSTEECCKDRYRESTDPTSTPTTSPPPSCKSCRKKRDKVGTKRSRLIFTIGPSGGQCGYEKLTGSGGGWGIAWYVDGCLIPHLKLQRGKNYTFCVLGGNDSSLPSEYHPLYLTSSPVGGYYQNIYSGMQMNETIYAGIDDKGNALYTGPLVMHSNDNITKCCTDKRPKCPKGAQIFEWTPDENTPDELYYQCATHFFLGWKISVMDNVEETN